MTYKYTSQKSFNDYLEKTKKLRMTDDRKVVEKELCYLVYLMKTKGLVGIKGDGYAYYPNKTFTVWKASDGSEFRSDLLGFLLDYVIWGSNLKYDLDPDYIADIYGVKKVYDQPGYEQAHMVGDESIESAIDQLLG